MEYLYAFNKGNRSDLKDMYNLAKNQFFYGTEVRSQIMYLWITQMILLRWHSLLKLSRL